MTGPSLIEIGTGPAGPVMLDVDILLRTRLLLQANSGGGKSWLLRVLAEQLAGKAQTIIIDPEGEFSTLREHFDFVLVGKGGDTPADVRTAALVAHKLLELGVSAVCDLFEMKVDARHAWVAAFLEAMIDAPKTLWHPAIVMIDETHIFAPERGFGESPASEGVAALATRGRKRGYTLVAATQRIGKLRKDVAAELQNVLVGPTFLDIDVERATDALGIPKAERKTFAHELKVMDPGKFIALGRAISKERIRVAIRGVVSSHPEPGSEKHSAEPPPPPAKIRAILAKLGDLPKEAAAKKANEETLQARIRELDGKLHAVSRDLETERHRLATAPPPPAPLPVPVVFKEELQALEFALAEGLRSLNGVLGKIWEAANPMVVSNLKPSPVTKVATVPTKVSTLAIVRSAPVAHRIALPSRAVTLTKPEGWTMEEEVLYQEIVKRLKREAPILLKVLAIEPELEVEVERKTVSINGDTLRGRTAALIPDGFFDEPREGMAVLNELRRRGGPSGDKVNYKRELDALAGMGFLTKEETGYQVVKSMKVNVKRT